VFEGIDCLPDVCILKLKEGVTQKACVVKS